MMKMEPICVFSAEVKTAFIFEGKYLVQDVDVVVFCGEAGVAVTQPVDHRTAGDNDGSEQSADAVLKGWRLTIKTKQKGGNKSQKHMIIVITDLIHCKQIRLTICQC